jgi:hypothetical protein
MAVANRTLERGEKLAIHFGAEAMRLSDLPELANRILDGQVKGRVVVDVNLATGAFTLDEAIDFFVRLVPMDVETAREECAMYLATPGLAMSYHVGKQQLLRLVTDAIVAQGDDFSLRELHDRVWANGNVPFSLQRWEILGDREDVDAIDAYGASTAGP